MIYRAMLASFGRFGLAGLSLVGVGSCVDTGCTELGCDNQALVSYPPGTVEGPYQLVLRTLAETVTVACNDPAAVDNPAGITCDSRGFELRGHPLATERSLLVTLLDVDGEVLVAEVEVRLDAVGEELPNGPNCPPVCVIRNGQLGRAPD